MTWVWRWQCTSFKSVMAIWVWKGPEYESVTSYLRVLIMILVSEVGLTRLVRLVFCQFCHFSCRSVSTTMREYNLTLNTVLTMDVCLLINHVHNIINITPCCIHVALSRSKTEGKIELKIVRVWLYPRMSGWSISYTCYVRWTLISTHDNGRSAISSNSKQSYGLVNRIGIYYRYIYNYIFLMDSGSVWDWIGFRQV